jgi:hypothetical protein
LWSKGQTGQADAAQNHGIAEMQRDAVRPGQDDGKAEDDACREEACDPSDDEIQCQVRLRWGPLPRPPDPGAALLPANAATPDGEPLASHGVRA